jgi:hypothetical protein
MGFPGGPAFAGPLNLPQQKAPDALGFYPMGPYLPLPGPSGIEEGEGNKAVDAGTGIPVTPTVAAPAPAPSPAPTAATPVKSSHVKVGAKKRGRPKGSKNKKVVIEIN